jgi:septum formation protein
MRKLEAYLSSNPSQTLPILAADTLVLSSGMVVGKAQTRAEAFLQLRDFSGKTHEVHSGFALSLQNERFNSPLIFNGSDRAVVEFNNLSDTEINTYLDTEEWIGAAGSYRIQGLGKHLVSRIDGDFSTVVGLPIDRISAILEKLAIDF